MVASPGLEPGVEPRSCEFPTLPVDLGQTYQTKVPAGHLWVIRKSGPAACLQKMYKLIRDA